MISVNLLPHRQVKRDYLKRQLGLVSVISIAAAAVVIFTGWTYIGAKIEEQSSRNRRLDVAITVLDKQISDIKSLKDQISAMLARKQVVENLQTNRSQAVVILDEISRQLPEGLFLRGIKQVGKLITIDGTADSNSRVATLMRTLSISKVMESPNLIEIKSSVVNGIKQNDFSFTILLKNQNTAQDDATLKTSKKKIKTGDQS